MPIRIYANRSYYHDSQRNDVIDICKAHWNDKSPAQRLGTYGSGLMQGFQMVDRPEDADVCALVMRWNWYVDHGRIEQARREVQAARRAGKPTIVFSLGDFTARLPFADVYLFEASGYRSRRGKMRHAAPPLFGDIAAPFYAGEPPLRPYRAQPAVSFCGQAGGTSRDFLERRLKNLARRLAFRAGLLRWEPTPFEHTWLRKEVLETFSASPLVDCHFIVRDQYRAGLEGTALDDAARRRSEQEFVENLVEADYTICVRGGGNYSKRFFEALCVGRVPVLIDTDCLLPFADVVDWDRYCVRVDVGDLARAPAAVAAFHARFTPETWAERQRECRQLWKERLTLNGFYAHLHEHLASFSGR